MDEEDKGGIDPDKPSEISRPAYTPLPPTPTIALIIILFAESICTSLLIPFVGLFVAFLSNISPDEAGYRSGFLIGLFMLGQVFSGKVWGHCSDTYGRRVPLLLSLTFGVLSMFSFGLSTSFTSCCVIRLIQGLLNGSSVIAKAIISEITDSTNQATGCIIVSATYSIGFILGSVCGGFLYDPVNNPKTQWLHLKKGGFFDTHPAFLPSFVITLYYAGALIFTFFVLPETNKHRRSLRSSKLFQFFASKCGLGKIKTTTVVVTEEIITEENRRSEEVLSDDDCDKVTIFPYSRESVDDNKEENSVKTTEVATKTKLSYAEAMQDAPIRNVAFFYMLLAASDITFSEVLPLWAVATPPEGLSLLSSDVAILNLCFSIPATIANFLFPKVCSFFDNDLRFWRASLCIASIPNCLIPFATLVSPNSFYFILSWGLLRQVGFAWCYSIIQLLTVKACPPGVRGSVFAIVQSLVSLTRCSVPLFATPLFAWSISGQKSFPLNHYLVFFLSSLPPIVAAFLTYKVELLRILAPDLMEETSSGAEEQNNHSDVEGRVSNHSIIAPLAEDISKNLLLQFVTKSSDEIEALAESSNREMKRENERMLI